MRRKNRQAAVRLQNQARALAARRQAGERRRQRIAAVRASFEGSLRVFHGDSALFRKLCNMVWEVPKSHPTIGEGVCGATSCANFQVGSSLKAAQSFKRACCRQVTPILIGRHCINQIQVHLQCGRSSGTPISPFCRAIESPPPPNEYAPPPLLL